MDTAQIPNLPKAVNRWLAFQLHCGRQSLLSEAYLGQPVAEFLIHHHSGSFETEFDHPVLQNPGPGRPRQIDYALLTRDAKALELAIECKWISEKPYDKQRILNDLLRLECVRAPGRHVRRFLLIGGLKDHFSDNFRDLEINVGGSRSWFVRHLLSGSRNVPEKVIDVESSSTRFRDFYKNFAKSFNTEIPKRFSTKCISSARVDDVTVYLWEICSSKNRVTFDPAVLWP